MLQLRKDFVQRIATGTGLSLTQFCKAHGLSRRTLAAWDAGAFVPEELGIARLTRAYAEATGVSRLDAQDHLFEEVADVHPRRKGQAARRQREATEGASVN